MLVHVTTTDMSLDWLLGPQLQAFVAAGYDVVRANYPGDIGLHVVKWLWNYMKYHRGEKPQQDITRWMGDLYLEASKRLEANPDLEVEVRALYVRYYVDYADLLVNLCLPAAEMATLCAFAHRPVRELSLSGAEMAGISATLTRAGEEDARASFRSAADRALAELNLRGEYSLALMRQTADDLWVRIRAAANG